MMSGTTAGGSWVGDDVPGTAEPRADLGCFSELWYNVVPLT